MDVAASEFFRSGKYDLDFKSPDDPSRYITPDELANLYKSFIKDYPGECPLALCGRLLTKCDRFCHCHNDLLSGGRPGSMIRVRKASLSSRWAGAPPGSASLNAHRVDLVVCGGGDEAQSGLVICPRALSTCWSTDQTGTSKSPH